MGERSSSSKHKLCPVEDERRPKRIRKQVERYGVVPQSVISPRKVIETRTLRRQTAQRTRRSTRLKSVSPKKPIKVEIEEEGEKEAKEEIKVDERTSLELCDLSEEVLLLILERIPACGLINLSRTSKQFNRLCVLDTIWKQRCRVSSCICFYRSFRRRCEMCMGFHFHYRVKNREGLAEYARNSRTFSLASSISYLWLDVLLHFSVTKLRNCRTVVNTQGRLQ